MIRKPPLACQAAVPNVILEDSADRVVNSPFGLHRITGLDHRWRNGPGHSGKTCRQSRTGMLTSSSRTCYFSNLMLRISLRLIVSSPGSFLTAILVFRNNPRRYGMAPRIGTLFSTRIVRVASIRTTFASSYRTIFPASVSVVADLDFFKIISQT